VAAAGERLDQQGFDRGVPADAQSWRILYGTTAMDGRPAMASQEGHGTPETGRAARRRPAAVDAGAARARGDGQIA